MLVVVPQAPARENAALVEPPAEFASLLVESGAHATPPHPRVHVDVGTVDRVGRGIVIREISAVGDARPRVVTERIRPHIDDQRRHGADNLPVNLRDELPLWEHPLMTDEVPLSPDDVFCSARTG